MASIDKQTIGQAFGNDVRQAERSVRHALREVASLAVSTIEATDALGVSDALVHPALEGLSRTMAGLTEAHGHIARHTHIAFERIGRRIGLDETSWGPGGVKPAIGPTSGEMAPELSTR